MKTKQEAEIQIYTIGHSNHSWERFSALLGTGPIEVVVDVRSSPFSRYAPHFNKEVIENALSRAGIKYLFLGNILGGRPETEEVYDEQGHVYYDRIEKSPQFKEGINRLLKGAQSYKVALLCGEEDPTQCHRRLLLGKVLSKHGVGIIHIRGDGRLQSEEDLTAEEDYQKHKGQMNLFAGQEEKEWKSTPSVSPKKARRSSLKS
jgi:uncharacterized protein (DUF488 family)